MSKIIFFILALFYFNRGAAQFSYVPIEDSIVLTHQNTKVFNVNELRAEDIKSLGLESRYEEHLDLDSLSLIIQNKNVRDREEMLKVVHSSDIRQRKAYESYVFQIFPVVKENSQNGFLVAIMLRDVYPDWRLTAYLVKDGGNSYSIIGVF